jgi:hypothetical protein
MGTEARAGAGDTTIRWHTRVPMGVAGIVRLHGQVAADVKGGAAGGWDSFPSRRPFGS